ncbi:MAG: GNAT family N-acetyltransferase [Bacteroidia bacterium]|nr:GNAT family N-acetyltransferase [Bacteroidia bacterium]
MPFRPEFQVLHTPRLLLRALAESDASQVQFLRSDATVNQFVRRPRANTLADALAFIHRIEKGEATNPSYYWSITKRESDTMIGSICLWNLSEEGHTAEIGYDLHPQWQGKGIMSEAIKAVLAFGFSHMGLRFIEAFTQQNNHPSLHLLRANGFLLQPDRHDEDNEENVVFLLERTG